MSTTTTATSPTSSTPASRIPVQPSPASRSRTPGQSVNAPPANVISKVSRQISSGSSGGTGGRALPLPSSGGSVGRSATSNANRTPLQPLMESLTSDHRHGTSGGKVVLTILQSA
jgi:hypothetical protein